MSWEATSAVKKGPTYIKGGSLNWLYALAELADKEGIVISRDTELGERQLLVSNLAEEAHCSEATARRANKYLSDLGVLHIERAVGRGNENAYRIDFDVLRRLRAEEDMEKNEQARAEGKDIKGINVTPFNRKKGIKLIPFIPPKPVNLIPFDAETGINLTPFPGGIKEPYLETIENDDSNQSPHVENFEETEPPTVPPPSDVRYSPYIASIVSDLSLELGDPNHTVSNVTQALKLFKKADVDEAAFADLLHETRKTVRRNQGRQGLRGIENKMAYFFTVLRSAVEEICSRGSPQVGMATYQQ